MNAKLLFKTVFLIVIALLLVLMGMHNKAFVSLSLPPLLPHDLSQPIAAIICIGFFGVGLLSGTILTAGGGKGGGGGGKAKGG